MGIRGLTTFINQNSDRFLENYQLQDTQLVIDGCALAAQLYQKCTKANDSFGGDYDKYHKVLLDFFGNIRKCKIIPTIIVDGGYEFKKFQTLKLRMNNRIQTSQCLNPGSQGYYQLNPLLQMNVFLNTLTELGINYVVCDFEADYQIASVARYLECPVLSNDSDFFVFDCLYIPTTTLDLQTYKSDNNFYLKCKLYRVDTFLNHFGGLDKSLLPLVATLLGNDYVSKSSFSTFFSQLKLSNSRTSMNDQQRTINALLHWLRLQTFEQAKARILGRVKQQERASIDKVINESVEGYRCNPDYILKYFKLLSSENEDGEYILIDTSDYKHRQFPVPNWFIKRYRSGQLPGAFINLITKQTYLFTHQMEDVTLPSSHNISLKVVQIIFGLLTSSKRYHKMSYIIRANQKSAYIKKIEPIYEIEDICVFPSLADLTNLPKEIKDSIFFFACNMQVEDVEILGHFPQDWQLIVIVINYWIRTISDLEVTKEHLLALILCVTYLKSLDQVIGYHRSQKVFENKLKKQLDTHNPTNLLLSDEELKETSLTDLLSNVSETDAVFAVNALISNFNVNEKLFTNPKNFSPRTVHCYAGFQSAYRHICYLNALLDYPFLPVCISSFYNGTFIYNVYTNLIKRNDPIVYLTTILKNAPSFLNVYNKVVHMHFVLTPSVFLSKNGDNTSKRKSRKNAVNCEW